MNETRHDILYDLKSKTSYFQDAIMTISGGFLEYENLDIFTQDMQFLTYNTYLSTEWFCYSLKSDKTHIPM